MNEEKLDKQKNQETKLYLVSFYFIKKYMKLSKF